MSIEKIYEEIMEEKFSNLVKTINPQIQTVQRTPNAVNINKAMSRHSMIR